MKKEFIIGDIVRKGSYVASIKKIEDGKATLGKNVVVALERLSQVEINGNYDQGIILECKFPYRAPIIAPVKQIPVRKTIPYLENTIEGKSIASIIKENGFTVVSELQDWIRQNAPDFFLRKKNGI